MIAPLKPCAVPGLRRPASSSLAALLLLAGAGGPLAGQATEGRAVVEGVVLETDSELPVAGARIAVIGTSIVAVTDSAGAFRLTGLPGGHTVLDVRDRGQAAPPVYLKLGPREERWIELVVTRVVLPVEELRVRIQGSPSRLAGFRRRRAAGIGEFISQGEIRRRSPPRLSELLRSRAGLEVGRVLFGEAPVDSRRGPCRLIYFLDGMRAEGLHIDALRPQDVIGIEIYHGGSRVPAQFVRRGACGAVVIWTREP